MNAYDLDLLRALGPRPRKEGMPVSILLLVGLGLLLAAAEGVLHKAGEARRAAEARRLEERELMLAPPASEADFLRLSGALRARADRVLWKPVLLAVAEALPDGDRLERISYDEESGLVRIDVRGPGGPPPGAFAGALRAAPGFTRFFDTIREEAGSGFAYSLLCERGTGR